jgi:hypothetical protein
MFTTVRNSLIWAYNRCRESGYILSKFILLDGCVERDWRIRKVCEWQIIRTAPVREQCKSIDKGRRGYLGVRLGAKRAVRRTWQLLQLVNVKINGFRSSWSSGNFKLWQILDLFNLVVEGCMSVALTLSEKPVGRSYEVHTGHSTEGGGWGQTLSL